MSKFSALVSSAEFLNFDDSQRNGTFSLILIVATIGETTSSQPAFQQTYPILPTAPIEDQRPQNYGSITEVITAQPVVNQIILVGACPVCRIGLLEDDYSCLGICLAIVCFPIGILCCLACKNKRCTNCQAII